MTAVSPTSDPALRIVAHNVVHLWAEPRRNSEMVSQTLMGRTVRVLKTEGDWSWVETDDTYRGWAETRWLVPEENIASSPVTTVFADVRQEPDPQSPLVERLPLLGGVYLQRSEHNRWIAVALPGTNADGWLPSDALNPLPTVPADTVGAAAARWGQEFRGTPYLWGGSSSFGLDCSGLVQLCYRLARIILRRDADIQRDDPRFVPVEQKDLQPGDLVFFGKPDKITHVGMHFEGNTFIHSAGGAGVIFTEWGDDRYSPGYVDARRLDPACAHEPVTRVEADDR